MDSVLTSIKKLLGITKEYTQFDVDLIIHINTVLAGLKQMGVLSENKTISSSVTTWSDLGVSENNISMIQSYVYMKVKMIWDPPQGSMNDVMDRQIKELEWRMFANSDMEVSS